MLLSTHILIVALVGYSLASSPPITATFSTVSTSIPPTITPFTLQPEYLKADPCPQSCALRYSSEYSSSLSCSGDNPATCVCQSVGNVAGDARACAITSCPVIKTDTSYKPNVIAKTLIEHYCSSQGFVYNSLTTYQTTPSPVVANVKMTSPNDADGTYPPQITNSPSQSALLSTSTSPIDSIFLSTDIDMGLASTMTATPSTPNPNSTRSSLTPDIPPRDSAPTLNPGTVVATTLGAVISTIAISLFYLWNKRRRSKTNTTLGKLEEPDPERDGESEVPNSQTTWSNHRKSKPFDKVVEVCEAREGQPADWTVAMRTTMKIDTQCENFNYISPDVVKALNLTPVQVDCPVEVTGVGEETTLVDTKVRLFFRRAGTVEKIYPPITFYVLKRNQDGWGLVLGTTDCLKFKVVRSAVLVLKPRKKEEKNTPNRDREIDDHRKKTEEKKKQKRKQDKEKEREKEARDREGSGRDRRGEGGGSGGRWDNSVRA